MYQHRCELQQHYDARCLEAACILVYLWGLLLANGMTEKEFTILFYQSTFAWMNIFVSLCTQLRQLITILYYLSTFAWMNILAFAHSTAS
jgi:hypothetical protein